MRQVTPLCYYSTSTVKATRSLQAQLPKVCHASLVLCCLDKEKVVSSDDNFVLASSGSLLESRCKIAKSVLLLEAVQDETNCSVPWLHLTWTDMLLSTTFSWMICTTELVLGMKYQPCCPECLT